MSAAPSSGSRRAPQPSVPASSTDRQAPTTDEQSRPSTADSTHARVNPPATPAPTRRAHGAGNWRSLVISVLVILGFVALWLALVPRPAAVERPSVDVTSAARVVAREVDWPVVVPSLGAAWKPTSVSWRPSEQGPKTWHIGYHLAADEEVYVAVEQTRSTGDTATDDAWIAGSTARGTAQGGVDIAGTTWQRFLRGGDVPRRSLLRRDGPVLIVVTGVAGEDQLRAVASALRPYAGG